MPIESPDTREGFADDSPNEVAATQNFTERILQEGLTDPLINQGFEHKDSLFLEVFRCEADELWSFVKQKTNKQWVWMVMNTYNRQIIALHVGGRGKEDAWKLWDTIPAAFQQQAGFFTDFWKAYNILDEEQHFAAGKDKGFVNHLERFNGTLRQRCSRLVRKALSFSKKQSNHVGAIKHFVCHYNQHLALHL